MQRPLWLALSLLVAALGSASCGGDGTGPGDSGTTTYCGGAGFELGSATTLHYVSASGSSDGDGSAAAPFDTVQAALDVAVSGDTIAVDTGTWAAGLTLDDSVTLVGCGATTTLLEAPAGAAGLRVTSDASVTLTRLAVTDGTGAGVSIESGTLVLDAMHVHGTVVDATGAAGHGVQATAGTSLTVTGCEIRDNVGVGILAIDAILIVDDTYLTGNDAGGIGAVSAPDTVSVVGCTVEDNGRFGVGLFGSAAALSANVICRTADTGQGGGDGVLVTPVDPDDPAVDVDISADNEIAESERAGVLVAGSGAATVGAMVRDSGLGGVWAQGAGASVTVASTATLAANAFVGAAATAGAEMQVLGATVSGTAAITWAPPTGGAPTSIGDGVAIFANSRLELVGATVTESARAGLLADAPDGSVLIVDDTYFGGGQYGVVMQGIDPANPPPDVDAVAAGNTFEDQPAGQSVLAEAGLTVRASLCPDPTDPAALCHGGTPQ